MRIGIAGPIATADIRHLLHCPENDLPEGYSGAPLLATLIAELLSRGHEVTAFTLSRGMPLDWRRSRRARGRNFELIYVPMRTRAWRPNGWLPGRIVDLYAFERRGLQHAIQNSSLDVVHAHWAYEFAWAAQSTLVPAVVTCHDSPFLVAKMASTASPTRSLYRWIRAGMAWHVLRRARHVTAVSDYMRIEAEKLCRCKVWVVPNPLPDQVSTEPSVDNQHRIVSVFAMVANGWDKRKNPRPAMTAFARLRALNPQIKLKLYGADYGVGEVAEQWAQKRGLSAGMEFIGRVPYYSLLRQLAGADVLLHPSLEETFGMSVAEAMSFGVPVIGGASSGAVPWVVGDGGKLVDVTSVDALQNAMQELIDHPELRGVLAEKARVRAQTHFTAEKVAEAYEAIYREAVAGQEVSTGEAHGTSALRGRVS